MEKLLAANKTELDAAKKDLAAAEKDLAADPKCKVRKEKLDASLTVFTSAKELYTSAKELYTEAVKDVVFFSKKRRKLLQNPVNRGQTSLSGPRPWTSDTPLSGILNITAYKSCMKKGHAQRIIRERPKLLEAEDDPYDASSIYVPHEIKNIDELRIPSIRPIPVNRGQTSLPGRLPWCADTPLNGILKVTQYNSCQISKDVINFLTENVEFLKRDPAASENRIHPLVNFFTNIVLNTVGDNVVTFQRNKRDPSSQSESGSPKRTFYRADVIYFVNGLPLVRIEEKAKSKDLSVAQAELVNKISQDWLTVECTTRFVIGIAVAGNIWTFHRITCEDVRKCRENKGHVVKEWERIDTLTDYGRLRGVQVAVHIASLIKYFTEFVHPRTVSFGKKEVRTQSSILITTNATLGLHVKKWYVSQIQCLIYVCYHQCILSYVFAIINVCYKENI